MLFSYFSYLMLQKQQDELIYAIAVITYVQQYLKNAYKNYKIPYTKVKFFELCVWVTGLLGKREVDFYLNSMQYIYL